MTWDDLRFLDDSMFGRLHAFQQISGVFYRHDLIGISVKNQHMVEETGFVC